MALNEFANANFVDFMATAFGQKISISSAGVLSAGWKTSGTVMSTLIKHAGVGATAGGTMDVVLQLGLQQIYDITNGKTGQKEFSITELLSAITGGAVVGAGVGAAFEYAAPYVSRVFGFVSEWIGGKLQKAKVTREVPIGESSSPVSLKNGGGSNSKLSIYETTPSDITGATEIRIGGKLVRTTPKARSLYYGEADAWYRTQVAKIPEMIDQSLSPQLQALQAWQLRQQIRSSATAALIDQGEVRIFEACHRLGSVEEAFSKAAQDSSGDVLFKKIVDASGELKDIRHPNEVGGCFVAGTLVWTDKGLVPIEQVKVGDMVLSKAEDGTGETQYKPVVRTITFDQKAVMLLRVWLDDDQRVIQIVATPNHPFWVDGRGWTALESLETTNVLSLGNGRTAQVIETRPIWETGRENVGFGAYDPISKGYLVDLEGDLAIDDDLSYAEDAIGGSFSTKVHNLEVADFHTYFVSESGIWVHNTNCAEVGVKPIDSTGVGVDPNGKAYFSSATKDVDVLVGEEISARVTQLEQEGNLHGAQLVVLTKAESRPKGSDAADKQIARAWERAASGALEDDFQRTVQWSLAYAQQQIKDGVLVKGSTNYITLDGRKTLNGEYINTLIERKFSIKQWVTGTAVFVARME